MDHHFMAQFKEGISEYLTGRSIKPNAVILAPIVRLAGIRFRNADS